MKSWKLILVLTMCVHLIVSSVASAAMPCCGMASNGDTAAEAEMDVLKPHAMPCHDTSSQADTAQQECSDCQCSHITQHHQHFSGEISHITAISTTYHLYLQKLKPSTPLGIFQPPKSLV